MTQADDVRVVARGTGRFGVEHVVVSLVRGGRRRIMAISLEELGSGSHTVLTALGILTRKRREKFLEEVERALRTMPVTRRVADRAGHFRGSFVWPTGRVNGKRDLLVSLPNSKGDGWREVEGSPREWRKIARFAVGNTRMMLALAHALSGPVVDLLDWESSMIQLVGAADALKSSFLAVVASIWGNDVRSWHGTPGGLEIVAMRHHATFLAIDDLRPAADNGRASSRAAYVAMRDGIIRLADGRLKERMHQQSAAWRLPMLSASNSTLDRFAQGAGLPLDANQAAARGRLLDVPLVDDSARLFENLHQFDDELDAMRLLNDVARANPGVVADAFVERLLAWHARDPRGLRDWLTARRDFYVTRARRRLINRAGYSLRRSGMKMGTIYAVGRLAIEFGIFPWRARDLFDAIMACHTAHIALYDEAVESVAGGGGERPPLDDLRLHVRRHRRDLVDLRGGLLDPRDHDHDACAGYIDRGSDGEAELLFADATLLRVCGEQARCDRLKRDLEAAGILRRCKARPSIKRTIYSGGRRREQVIAINAAGLMRA